MPQLRNKEKKGRKEGRKRRRQRPCQGLEMRKSEQQTGCRVECCSPTRRWGPRTFRTYNQIASKLFERKLRTKKKQNTRAKKIKRHVRGSALASLGDDKGHAVTHRRRRPGIALAHALGKFHMGLLARIVLQARGKNKAKKKKDENKGGDEEYRTVLIFYITSCYFILFYLGGGGVSG